MRRPIFGLVMPDRLGMALHPAMRVDSDTLSLPNAAQIMRATSITPARSLWSVVIEPHGERDQPRLRFLSHLIEIKIQPSLRDFSGHFAIQQ
jgi:hypothetical protein